MCNPSCKPDVYFNIQPCDSICPVSFSDYRVFLKVPITAMMLLVNENFIFLCGFIIIAYWKTELGWQKWIFSVLSLLSLSFLASGFALKIIYPIFLIGLGYFRFIIKRKIHCL